jgi:hypothetical protein
VNSFPQRLAVRIAADRGCHSDQFGFLHGSSDHNTGGYELAMSGKALINYRLLHQCE